MTATLFNSKDSVSGRIVVAVLRLVWRRLGCCLVAGVLMQSRPDRTGRRDDETHGRGHRESWGYQYLL